MKYPPNSASLTGSAEMNDHQSPIYCKNPVIYIMVYQSESWMFHSRNMALHRPPLLPFKANLAKQEGRLANANGDLAKAQVQLDEKQAELDKVQAKFDSAMNEKMVRWKSQNYQNDKLRLHSAMCCI